MTSTEVQQKNTTQVQIRPLLPIAPLQVSRHCPPVRLSPPAELCSPQVVSLPEYQPFCSHTEVILLFTGENSSTVVLSQGLVSIPTPTWLLSPWASPQKDKVQCLSRSLVPEPVLCMEVSSDISCWYRSTSRTSSGSFPAREVMFHVLTTSLRCQGSACLNPRLCLPPGLQSTQPQCYPCRWQRATAPCSLFGLCLAESHSSRLSHQTLAGKLTSYVWLVAPFSLSRWGAAALFRLIHMGSVKIEERVLK